MNRKAVWIGGVVVAVAAGAVYFSPHYAVHQIGKAVKQRDASTVGEYVDFPALRENMKGHMLIAMDKRMSELKTSGNMFAGLGQLLAAKMMEQALDTMISPAGLMLMLDKGQPTLRPTDVAGAGKEPTADRPKFAVNYRDFSTVLVHREDADRNSGFVLKRSNLFGWKVVGVQMPELQQ